MFQIDAVFGVVAFAAYAAFCYSGSERLPALSTICLFGCLACVCAFVCFALVCQNVSLPFIQLLLFEQYTSVFYLNSHYSFEMYYNIPRAEAPLLVIKMSVKTSPQRFKVLLCFATKRNEHKLILHENIHATHE